jgi:hypothetical protein
MDRLLAQQLLKEQRRRVQVAAAAPDLMVGLFPKQKKVVLDQSKNVALHCGRRAGKTVTVCTKAMLVALEHPSCEIPVLELTKDCMAARAFWKELKRLDGVHGLGCRFNDQHKVMRVPNGATISILGVNQEDLTNRLRGEAFPIIILDEAGHFRPSVQRYLLEDVLDAARLDYESPLFLAGTPGLIPAGPFFEACHGPAWSVYHWTVFENPHLPHARVWVDQMMGRYGWTVEHPKYRREWMGEWIVDDTDAVYPWNPVVNALHVDPRPERPKGAIWVLGLDLGYVDSTAFVLVRFDPAGTITVVESYKKRNLIPSAVAVEVERWMERYPIDYVVADSGGIGKAYVEEMRQRYELPIEAAKKQNKLAYIELQAGDLRSGRTKVYEPSNKQLVEEMQLVRWKDRFLRKIDDKFEDHLCDAFVYATRDGRDLLQVRGKPVYAEGSPEWWAQQEEKVLEDDPDLLDLDDVPWWDED